MSVNLIVIIIFIAGLLIIAVAYRKNTLDKLEDIPGERILFEERGVKVEQAGAPRTAIFFKCIVRITTARIVIAQKALWQKTYVLRHIIYYNESSGPFNKTDLGASLKSGHLVFSVDKSKVKISRSSDGDMITIGIPETLLTAGQYIRYKTQFYDSYIEIFG